MTRRAIAQAACAFNTLPDKARVRGLTVIVDAAGAIVHLTHTLPIDTDVAKGAGHIVITRGKVVTTEILWARATVAEAILVGVTPRNSMPTQCRRI